MKSPAPRPVLIVSVVSPIVLLACLYVGHRLVPLPDWVGQTGLIALLVLAVQAFILPYTLKPRRVSYAGKPAIEFHAVYHGSAVSYEELLITRQYVTDTGLVLGGWLPKTLYTYASIRSVTLRGDPDIAVQSKSPKLFSIRTYLCKIASDKSPDGVFLSFGNRTSAAAFADELGKHGVRMIDWTESTWNASGAGVWPH